MRTLLNILKSFVLAALVFGLSACSSEPDPKLEAQKRLEAEAEEIQAKARARKEFKERYCKDPSVDCQKLMKEAGLDRTGKDLY